MYGLDLMMAGLLTLASSQPAIECVADSKAKVSVVPSRSDVTYDFSKDRAAMQEMHVDTISPYGKDRETHLNGAMSGSIQIESSVNYLGDVYTSGQVCVYIDQIGVKIHFDPTIYIVSEYPEGTCEHEAVLEHEKKHLKINQIVINKYTDRIAKTLSYALNKYGWTFGPVPEDNTQALYQRLNDYYVGIVKSEEQRMYEELTRLNQDLDSLEEYERVGNACR